MFYLNPGTINFHQPNSALNWRLTCSGCRASQFLEDLKLDHGELEECDKRLEEKIASCIDGVYKIIEARILMKELEQKVSGMWCVIL